MNNSARGNYIWTSKAPKQRRTSTTQQFEDQIPYLAAILFILAILARLFSRVRSKSRFHQAILARTKYAAHSPVMPTSNELQHWNFPFALDDKFMCVDNFRVLKIAKRTWSVVNDFPQHLTLGKEALRCQETL
jgi:hypothetical protein